MRAAVLVPRALQRLGFRITGTGDVGQIGGSLSDGSVIRFEGGAFTVSGTFANVTTTNGLVMANVNITHHGTATANLYAGGTITMSTQSPGLGLTNGATANPGQPSINFAASAMLRTSPLPNTGIASTASTTVKPAFFSVKLTIWRIEAESSTARIECMAFAPGEIR